jgi:hypothetical protein
VIPNWRSWDVALTLAIAVNTCMYRITELFNAFTGEFYCLLVSFCHVVGKRLSPCHSRILQNIKSCPLSLGVETSATPGWCHFVTW